MLARSQARSAPGLRITLLVAGTVLAPPARAMPLLPLAQGGVVDITAAQQIGQQMQGDAAQGNRPQMNPQDAAALPPGGAAAGGGASTGNGGLSKYLPAYILIALFTGLGIAAVGRPVKRVAPDGT